MDTEKTVGTILREARLAKHMSLAEVERGTSIRSRYLEAVENDEYGKTPGEVFLKGMIRNYGNFLGLDGLELVKLYKSSAAGKAGEEARRSNAIREVDKVRLNIQLKNPRDIGSGTGHMEMPKLPWKQIGAGLAAVVILAGGYIAVPKAIDYLQNRPQQTEQQEAKPEEGTKQQAPVLDRVTLSMEATGSCWTEVRADGKEVFAGMLKAGDKKSFEAKDKLIVKYGNIGVMKLVVNGEPVEMKGEHGVAVKTYAVARPADAAAKQAEPQQEVAAPATVQEPAPVEKEVAPAAAASAEQETAAAAPKEEKPAVEPAPAPAPVAEPAESDKPAEAVK